MCTAPYQHSILRSTPIPQYSKALQSYSSSNPPPQYWHSYEPTHTSISYQPTHSLIRQRSPIRGAAHHRLLPHVHHTHGTHPHFPFLLACSSSCCCIEPVHRCALEAQQRVRLRFGLAVHQHRHPSCRATAPISIPHTA
eukprot:1583560-Rhodomonas_salina.3